MVPRFPVPRFQSPPFPKVLKMYSFRKPWKSTFSITPMSFDASSPKNPRKYDLHKPYIARNYSHWATSLSLIVWVYLLWVPKTHVFWNRVRNDRWRPSKVIDFGTNRKRVCKFLLVINSNLGLSCPVSEILQFFCWVERPQPYSTWILGCSPWTRLPTLWLRGAQILS